MNSKSVMIYLYGVDLIGDARHSTKWDSLAQGDSDEAHIILVSLFLLPKAMGYLQAFLRWPFPFRRR